MLCASTHGFHPVREIGGFVTCENANGWLGNRVLYREFVRTLTYEVRSAIQLRTIESRTENRTVRHVNMTEMEDLNWFALATSMLADCNRLCCFENAMACQSPEVVRIKPAVLYQYKI